MRHAADALQYPNHFPPTTRWKKFFIGVRWLGPDLSFFKDLKTQQAARHRDEMRVWGGGARQEFAELLARTLSQRLGWKSTVFFPQDSLAVVCNGPRFDFIDDFALEKAMLILKKAHGVTVPRSFWNGKERCSFGDFIDELVELKGRDC